mgnify:CR=1 FL=1
MRWPPGRSTTAHVPTAYAREVPPHANSLTDCPWTLAELQARRIRAIRRLVRIRPEAHLADFARKYVFVKESQSCTMCFTVLVSTHQLVQVLQVCPSHSGRSQNAVR